MNDRLKHLAHMTVESLGKLGEYERNCTCVKGEGASQQLTPGCPVHWPNAPRVITKVMDDGVDLADGVG